MWRIPDRFISYETRAIERREDASKGGGEMQTIGRGTRRNFLLGAGLFAAGAAVAVAAARTKPQATDAVPAAAATSGGYQASPHVLKYYETTAF
jgi:hypothetical protein